MTQQELHEAFVAFIEAGDEESARAFLIEHLNEFPEEMKKEIAFAFFTEAVQKEAGVEEVKRNALDVMKELDEVEAILADAEKAVDIKEDIG